VIRSPQLKAKNKSPIVEMKYIDWPYYEKLENPTFDDVIDRCKKLGLYETMGFRYGWNREILVNSIALTIMILIKHYYLDHSRREVLH
jgi:hypothetical protein